MKRQWIDKIFEVEPAGFDAMAMEIFRFQFENNSVYNAYVKALGIQPDSVQSPEQIPFLPVRFFQNNLVQTTPFEPALVFESSGTTGSIPSRHFVPDPDLYEHSFENAFEIFYGTPEGYCILGLLPSYLERSHSSLVYMVDHLVKESGHPLSGFYLQEHESLIGVLKELDEQKQKTILIGVTFALLDLADIMKNSGANGKEYRHLLVMETGGMKGRREEMVRGEVHDILKKAFGLKLIHSEYGMTEALSQAYSAGNGLFYCPPWMKIMLRDEEDPLLIKPLPLEGSEEGVINIIDFANVYSCAFLATDDIGRLYPDGSFEVLGRMDGTDLRGCSLMVV